MKTKTLATLNNPRTSKPLYNTLYNLHISDTSRTISNKENIKNNERKVAKSFINGNELIKEPNKDKELMRMKAEIDELKGIVEVKKEHLMVLRRQMAEQSIESCLSDPDGFHLEEEKASTKELEELVADIKKKEIEYFRALRGIKPNTEKLKDITPIFNTETKTELFIQDDYERDVELDNEKEDTDSREFHKTLKSFVLELLNRGRTIYKDKEWEELISNNSDCCSWLQSALGLLKGKLCFM